MTHPHPHGAPTLFGISPTRRTFILIAVFFFALFALNAFLHPPAVSVPSFSAANISISIPFFGTKDTAPKPNEVVIAIVLVVFGSKAANDARYAIKGVMLQSSKPVALHVVCTEDAIPTVQNRLDLVTRPAHDVSVTFYTLNGGPDAVRARARRAGVPADVVKGADSASLAKLFLHELLPASVPSALYITPSSVFSSDPFLLWRASNLTSEHLLSLSEGRARVSVMALNLERMRDASFVESSLRAETVGRSIGGSALFKSPNVTPKPDVDVDVGGTLLRAMQRAHPDRFGSLSRSWDVNACEGYYGVTMQGDAGDELTVQHTGSGFSIDEALFPGLVHVNCDPSKEGRIFSVTDTAIQEDPRWGALVGLTAQYKWVWLNQGQGAGRLTTHVERDLRFEDERVAGSRKPGHLGIGAHGHLSSGGHRS
ncbi:hypothetical protein EXIGLDRAFT_721602 [Exidia glandulosa HHB12029]|uniref:Uncharacterized protein n=1 Tax=Exidia glandulosa HHB12029 TaxID=1314781 RepID=A0A165FLR8_EXIGL|nr:hypothetical protein EXIGLDRAFT_721602 [Exidia glandulosa HHB12029]